MRFDLRDIFKKRLGENYVLHHRFLNRTLVQVQRTIGLDVVYERAEGAYLYDREGQEYLDFLSGYGVFNIGRNHPVVKKALHDAIDLDAPNMVQMDCALLAGVLAERLCQRLAAQGAEHLDAVFLCNSGTESVEAALKFARAATGRPRYVHLAGSWHGLTMGSLSVMGCGSFREGFEPLLDGCAAVKMGDLDGLERELRRRDVAALIMEPVQGKGVHFPTDDFYLQAQALCRRYGTLLICDEVQTGLGRTGAWFAFEHWKLEPDIITLAKTLSGGFVPCAAMVTRRKIYQGVFSRLDRCVVHSTSFGRNNLAAAAALATLHVLEEEKLPQRAAVLGRMLDDCLHELKNKQPKIRSVRVKGLMCAVDFSPGSEAWDRFGWETIHALDHALYTQLVVTRLMRKHRILSQVAGHGMDTLKILPPLVCSESDIERFVLALDECLQSLTAFPAHVFGFGGRYVRALLPPRRAVLEEKHG
jgi:ornithine--oxo-acid transaminase